MHNTKALFLRASILLVAAIFNNQPAQAGFTSEENTTSTLEHWQNPSVFRINKLPARAFYYPVTNEEDAFTREPWKQTNYQLLNGTWKFKWVNAVSRAPQNFQTVDYDDSQWDDFAVPANWEVNGYGSPFYHSHYCLKPNTEQIELPLTYNPVGSYRKIINIDKSWDDNQIILHLGAVKSAFYLYVNGQNVGYSEDSKTAAEFDITDFVELGKNTIAMQVFRYSTGSYFECQDMWRVSGIERDVYLYAAPKVRIADFHAQTTLTDNYRTGVLNFTALIGNRTTESAKGYRLAIELLDHNNVKIASKSININNTEKNNDSEVTTQILVPNASVWSAETPYLYQLKMALVNGDGEQQEWVGQHIGFRSSELKGGQILINGQAVLFKGVNRHEHDPVSAHVITRESMRKDVELMKAFNINALRMAHYPHDPYIYYLADKYGLYVMDEANIESHGIGAANQGGAYDPEVHLVNKVEWKDAYIDRVSNMYHRTKNHPSVVMRSLGNESGDGVNLELSYDWLKQQEPNFPVISEQAQLRRHTDAYGQMYASLEQVERFAKTKQDLTRPMILIEYEHAMGNSLGNFNEYWQLFERYPQLQGGFIWDWVDQTFAMKTADGRDFWGYGGDLEPPFAITAKSFSANGLVYADRTPYPYLWEVKHAQQNIGFSLSKASNLAIQDGQGSGQSTQVEIRNKRFFKNLSDIELTWQLLVNGDVVESGDGLILSAEPQSSQIISIPVVAIQHDGKEQLLNLQARLVRAQNLLPEGHIVASEQISLSKLPMPIAAAEKGTNRLSVSDNEERIQLSGKDFDLVISKTSGLISSMIFAGDQLLSSNVNKPVHPNFWRAPTDNDFPQKGYGDQFGVWQHAGSHTELTSISVQKVSSQNTKVLIEQYLPAVESRYFTTYDVYGNGTIDVDVYFYAAPHKRRSYLPRIGTQFVLNKDYQHVAWYGRGPHENYIDRKSSAFVGLYQSTVSELEVPYVRPQENGHRTDIRFLSFVNSKGNGLKFTGLPLLAFNASNFDMHEFDSSEMQVSRRNMHPTDLIEQDHIFVNIDYAQRGVGGTDSWGSKPLYEYTLPWLDYRYQYRIEPVRKD
jgi:beta-galactosidase